VRILRIRGSLKDNVFISEPWIFIIIFRNAFSINHSDIRFKVFFVNRGYRGKDKIGITDIVIPKTLKRESYYLKNNEKRDVDPRLV